MNKNEELQEECPEWLTEKHSILEPEFCRAFLQVKPMLCIHGHFYSLDGMIADDADSLKKEIYDMINPWLDSKISRKVNELFNALKIAAYSGEMLPECDRIHVANGTYFLDGYFSDEKQFCRNRLSVAYRPDAPKPELWLRFLSELLIPEDILILQEYLGYCFLPTTKGQKQVLKWRLFPFYLCDLIVLPVTLLQLNQGTKMRTYPWLWTLLIAFNAV